MARKFTKKMKEKSENADFLGHLKGYALSNNVDESFLVLIFFGFLVLSFPLAFIGYFLLGIELDDYDPLYDTATEEYKAANP